MKNRLRITHEQRRRAQACATAVHTSFIEWTAAVLMQHHSGRLYDHGVAKPAGRRPTTRENSENATVCEYDLEPAEFRAAIALAVLVCEKNNPAPYVPELRAGIDYIVKG